jgi:subtilisin family serine protease
MSPLDLTGLSPLMSRTCGIPEIAIGLIDGPVAKDHPELVREYMRFIPGRNPQCKDPDSAACRHGTFIAGILHAKRDSEAPAICPDCTLLVRPVFSEIGKNAGEPASATPVELALAILDCIDEGASILNLSIELEEPCPESDLKLTKALDYAAQREVIVVVAAGNRGTTSGSAMTRHPWVIPVVACDPRGRPSAFSNMTGSIRRNGLRAPGEKITSLGPDGQTAKCCGTSTATPFVTGAVALLWSEFRELNAAEIKSAVCAVPHHNGRRSSLPRLLNAWQAYRIVKENDAGTSMKYRGKAA